MKSVEYFKGTRQFQLEEKECNQGITNRSTQVKEGKQDGGQISSQVPLDTKVPGYLPSTTSIDTGAHCPLCPPKTLQVTESFSSESNVTVKFQFDSGLQSQLCKCCKCWAPRGALRNFLKSNAELSLVNNTKPQTSLFTCLYHFRPSAFPVVLQQAKVNLFFVRYR